MLVSLVPGFGSVPARLEVVLAEHVVHVDARAGNDDARAGARRR